MESYSDIYNQYARQVYHFLFALTRDEKAAEELTQETFYQAFLHIGQFQHKCSLYTWLCQIGKNAYYKEYHKKKRADAQITDLTQVHSDDFVSGIIDKERILKIHKILHTIPEPYKEVFQLKVFGELKFKEIAAIFDKSESWAKVTYYRCKEKIAKELEDES